MEVLGETDKKFGVIAREQQEGAIETADKLNKKISIDKLLHQLLEKLHEKVSIFYFQIHCAKWKKHPWTLVCGKTWRTAFIAAGSKYVRTSDS